MDNALTLNGLDELKERLAAESRERWLEVTRGADELPGRLKHKALDALEEKFGHLRYPATLDEREALHTWRRFQTIAGSSLSEAAKDEARAFQSGINRAHAAVVERLYGLAVTADRVAEHVLTTNSIELRPEERASLFDALEQYRLAHQDGGPTLDNTHFDAGLYAGAFGLHELIEKLHALAPPAPPAESVPGDELRDAFLRDARSLLDEHFARARASAVEACRKVLANQFHEFSYYPEAYMSWLHSINEAVRRMRDGTGGDATATPGGFPPAQPGRHACPHCRAENDSDDELIFCAGCGRAFRREAAGPEAAASAPPRVCAGCGATLNPGNTFCGGCGRRAE